MQPSYDDLVIATHGRSAFIMDDMAPVQQLQRAIAQGSWLFTPRYAREWTQHSDSDATLTNYSADNPPYGVTITFYQKEPQKSAPSLQIVDARGRAIRCGLGNAQSRR